MYFYLAMVGFEPTPTATAAPSNTETTAIPSRPYIYMVGLNHQQCKTIYTERFRLSPSSEFTGTRKKNQNFNISTGKSRKNKIIMKMFLNLLFKFTLNDQRN